MFRYRVSGLVVESTIALPDLIAAADAVPPDITITDGSVPSMLDDVLATGPNWSRSRDQLLLDIPSIGRFLLSHGRDIAFTVEPGADDDIAIFLSGNVIGLLLHQRGQIVLLAGAVSVGGRAVLFCGRSAVGKSTLVAALTARGYPILADDQCVIARDTDGQPVLVPEGRRLKLWGKSIDALGLGDDRGPPLRTCLQKYVVEAKTRSATPLPVGAIYTLVETRRPGTEGIARANVVDAAKGLLSHAYRPLLARGLGQRTAYFEMGAAIGAVAGSFVLARPMSFAAMDATIAMLEAHWTENGLAEAP